MQVLKNNMQFYFIATRSFQRVEQMSSVSLLLKITKNSFLVQTEEYLNETINLN